MNNRYKEGQHATYDMLAKGDSPEKVRRYARRQQNKHERSADEWLFYEGMLAEARLVIKAQRRRQ